MLAPITGTPNPEILYGLNGNALRQAFNMPSWVDYSSTGTTISKLFNCLYNPVNEIQESINYYNSQIGSGELEEPRLCVVSKVPSSLYDDVTYDLFKNITSYYRNELTGSWISICTCTSLSDFYLSEGPCLYLNDSIGIFRNLEKKLESLTSTTLNSEGFYNFELTDLLKDTNILFTEEIEAPPSRWGKIKYSQLTNNTVSLPSSGYYFYYSKNNISDFYIKWVTNEVSGSSTGHVADLKNTWDKHALKCGIVRKSNESNSSLKERILASIYNKKDFTRVNTAINIGKELGTVSVFSWIGENPLNLSSTGNIYIQNFPQYEWITETLSSIKLNEEYFFTRSKRNCIFHLDYLNEKVISITEDSGGVLKFRDSVNLYENMFTATSSFIFKNWEVSGQYLIPTDNLVKNDYIVLLENSINLISLTDSRYRNKIKDGYKLTDLTLSILLEHKTKVPVYYSYSKWGKGRFFSSESVVSKPTVIPSRFDD